MDAAHHAPRSFSLSGRNLCLCPVQNFLELRNTMPHARVHVGFGTLDVIMKIVAEELNVRDGARRDSGIREMAREENKGDVADVFSITEARKMSNLKGRVAV